MIQLNRLYYESKPSCISKSKIHINQSVSNPQSLNGIKLVQSNGFTFMIWAAIFKYCFYFFLPNLHMWDSPVGDLLFLFVFVFLLHLMKYLCGNLLVFNFIMCVWWSLVCDMLMFNVNKKKICIFLAALERNIQSIRHTTVYDQHRRRAWILSHAWWKLRENPTSSNFIFSSKCCGDWCRCHRRRHFILL